MPKTKSGEQITWKEFGKRWKEGMQNLTPAQRVYNDLMATRIVLLGFIVSLVAIIFFNKTFGVITYGLGLIFIGSIYSNIIKMFSLKGQYEVYKNMETQLNMEVITNG